MKVPMIAMMSSSVSIATARCGLDGADQAGGLACRTLQGRSAAEDEDGPAILFRDAKASVPSREDAGGK
jgi:hypothetical protein